MVAAKSVRLFILLSAVVLAASCRQPAQARPEPAEEPRQAPTVKAASESPVEEGAAPRRNSSFEAVEQNLPAGWTSTRVDGEPGWVTSDKLCRTGGRAVVLRGRGRDVGARLISEPIGVKTGDAVDFLVWVRPEGPATHSPSACVEGLTGKTWEKIEPVATGPMLRTSKYRIHFEWSPRGYTVFVPEGVSQVRLVLSCSATESPEVAWYADDFTCRVSSYAAYADAQPDRPMTDVFVLGIDTLSQNAVGCYGGHAVHTPNIDMLAREGVQFKTVTPTAPWTKPSFGSILTSLYPSQHGAQLVNSQLPDSVTTLAEVFKQQGYFTVGFARAPYDGFIGPGMNFNQGFDIYFYADRDELVFEAIERFLDTNREHLLRKKGGLFVFWHQFEPHTPFVNQAPGFIKNKGKAGDAFNNDLAAMSVLDNRDLYNEEDIRYIRACYDSEVGLVDSQIGGIFRRLKRLGLYDQALMVLCADHGESFGEKPGVWNHSHPYITNLLTPLVFRLPGGAIPPAADTGAMASNLDIMPTILAAVGVAAPEHCEGRDLFSGDDGPTAHYAISEDKALRTGGSLVVREGRYRLVANKATRWEKEEDWTTARWTLYGSDATVQYELYDIETDPFELDNIAARQPEVVQRLRDVLDKHTARTGIASEVPGDAPPAADVSQETREQLEAQGYGGADRKKKSQNAPANGVSQETLDQLKALGYLGDE